MPWQQRWSEELAQGTDLMGVDLDDRQKTLLVQYLLLLCKWNRAYNLTAIRDEREMVSRQLLDSLSIHSYIVGDSILDVGTGPGLPGIPLAVLMPKRQFVLLDSNGKKTRFVQQAKVELQLDNLQVQHTRVESLDADHRFNTITSRAFSSLLQFVSLTGELLHPNGQWVAMKGSLPIDELAELEQQGYQVGSHPLSVPGCSGERHVVIVKAMPDGA